MPRRKRGWPWVVAAALAVAVASYEMQTPVPTSEPPSKTEDKAEAARGAPPASADPAPQTPAVMRDTAPAPSEPPGTPTSVLLEDTLSPDNPTSTDKLVTLRAAVPGQGMTQIKLKFSGYHPDAQPSLANVRVFDGNGEPVLACDRRGLQLFDETSVNCVHERPLTGPLKVVVKRRQFSKLPIDLSDLGD